MQSLLSWWSSLETVSVLSTVLKCTGAGIGVLILIVGFRESELRRRSAESERRPRSVSREQQVAFKTALSAVTPEPIWLAIITTSAEASDFGFQVGDALTASGFTVLLERPHGSGGDAPPGIKIQYPEAKKPLADALADAFHACRFQVNLIGIKTSDAGASLKITIGEKPIKQ